MSNIPPHPHILVIPFPAQGHLIPLLDLTHRFLLLCSPLTITITITVLVTPQNLPLLSPLLSSSPSVQPLVLEFPTTCAEHVRSLPSPNSMASLIRSLSLLSPQILSWAHSLTNPPTALLSDFFLGWTHRLAQDLNRIPRFAFYSSGALLVALFHHLFRAHDVSTTPLPPFRYDHFPSLFRRYDAFKADPDWDFVKDSMVANSENYAAVLNTFDALESKYLLHLRQLYGHARVWAVGPIGASIPGSGTRGGTSSVPLQDLLTWLDACPEKSVVYVCFGSQFELKGPQLAALTSALKLSGARFVWCVGRGEIPEEDFGFGGKGLFIKGWAPQVEVLGHASVGAFLTHCGWNSVLEGIVKGVLLLTWPMEADQFVNARLLVEEMGVAVEACEGGPEVVPEVGELAKVVAWAVDGEMWKEVKERAAEMGRLARVAVEEEGGSSRRDMDKLVKELGEVRLVVVKEQDEDEVVNEKKLASFDK